jgi:toxin ParE1/3/4
MPGLGVARPDIRPDLRLWPVGNYLILYWQVDADVEVVRVLPGARNWPDLL